jgi:hypothetical protein
MTEQPRITGVAGMQTTNALQESVRVFARRQDRVEPVQVKPQFPEHSLGIIQPLAGIGKDDQAFAIFPQLLHRLEDRLIRSRAVVQHPPHVQDERIVPVRYLGQAADTFHLLLLLSRRARARARGGRLCGRGREPDVPHTTNTASRRTFGRSRTRRR